MTDLQPNLPTPRMCINDHEMPEEDIERLGMCEECWEAYTE